MPPEVRPPLTARQSEVLAAIASSIADRGYPPSIRELAGLVGLSVEFPNGITGHVRALIRKGYVSRDAGVARGLRVISRSPHSSTCDQPHVLSPEDRPC